MAVNITPETVNAQLAKIAKSLEQEVFQRIKLNTPTVFLVGAGRSSASILRDEVRDELEKKPRIRGKFDVYYPEELFEELLWGSRGKANLLELENLLARSVHAVVIILESEGPIAELGAFANHHQLQNRLVVVIEKQYKKARSFIMLGPVKYLREQTKSHIVYYDPKKSYLEQLGQDIRAAVRQLSREITVDSTVSNPIAAHHYLRAAIHVLHPVKEKTLQFLINRAIADTGNDGYSEHIVSTALGILMREREVTLASDGYSLTTAGRDRLVKLTESQELGPAIVKSLDSIRINALTWRLRRPTLLTA